MSCCVPIFQGEVPEIAKLTHILTCLINWLATYSGWWLTYPAEKYKSVGMIIPNIWKKKTCSKPPTSIFFGEYNWYNWLATNVVLIKQHTWGMGASPCTIHRDQLLHWSSKQPQASASGFGGGESCLLRLKSPWLCRDQFTWRHGSGWGLLKLPSGKHANKNLENDGSLGQWFYTCWVFQM